MSPDMTGSKCHLAALFFQVCFVFLWWRSAEEFCLVQKQAWFSQVWVWTHWWRHGGKVYKIRYQLWFKGSRCYNFIFTRPRPRVSCLSVILVPCDVLQVLATSFPGWLVVLGCEKEIASGWVEDVSILNICQLQVGAEYGLNILIYDYVRSNILYQLFTKSPMVWKVDMVFVTAILCSCISHYLN